METSPEFAASSCRLLCNNSIQSIALLALLSLLIITSLGEQHSQSAGSTHHQHHHHHHHRHQHKASEEVKPNPYQHVKILIPNLPPTHYQYWLKNHPRAAKVYGDICEQVGPRLAELNDLAEFQKLHTNLSFEDPQYMFKLEYGKQVLSLICSKITDVNKSCWGYENNCQEIHLMPECQQTDLVRAKDEQDQKITWFSQADFGYILDRAKELGRYCAPDKRANPADVSSFECTKHFTTCRGNNLFARFNISALANSKRDGNSADQSRVLSELGGWACDLQTARIAEEAGPTGRLESWYGELKGYARVDHLEPKETCDIVEDRQVFFVKINSTNNLDDYLGTFINLYATIHLNNRFSEDNQIILWNRQLPHSKTFEQLWYAFSRLPPRAIGQLDGKRVCFKKFVFAMPPNMIDGLHTDKPLIEGCSKSGLYNAFHKHVVHRLKIPNVYSLDFHRKTQGRLLRIAILSRASKSEFRNILNELELQKALNSSSSHYVQVLRYNTMDFNHVLLDALNSDIMIGLHGTGLAYSLFLPDWAGLIELHDCGRNRYQKLARLRGISYFKPNNVQMERGFMKKIRVTEDSPDWPRLNQSRLLDHDEFNNYEINVEQFMELFSQARDQVLKARDDYFKQSEPSGMGTTSRPETEEQTTPARATTTEVPTSTLAATEAPQQSTDMPALEDSPRITTPATQQEQLAEVSAPTKTPTPARPPKQPRPNTKIPVSSSPTTTTTGPNVNPRKLRKKQRTTGESGSEESSHTEL